MKFREHVFGAQEKLLGFHFITTQILRDGVARQFMDLMVTHMQLNPMASILELDVGFEFALKILGVNQFPVQFNLTTNHKNLLQ